MMTRSLQRHPEQYLQGAGFTRHFQCFRDVGPCFLVTKPTSGFCELDLGISESFRRKLEIAWGEASFGDDHDTVSRTPRTISPHPSVHTPHSTSKANTSTPRSGLLRVLARSSHVYSWHTCFRCLQDAALQVLGVLKPSWQHLRFARYLQRLRTIRPPAV